MGRNSSSTAQHKGLSCQPETPLLIDLGSVWKSNVNEVHDIILRIVSKSDMWAITKS